MFVAKSSKFSFPMHLLGLQGTSLIFFLVNFIAHISERLSKGQFISEWNFVVFKSPKKSTKFHSEINWPLTKGFPLPVLNKATLMIHCHTYLYMGLKCFIAPNSFFVVGGLFLCSDLANCQGSSIMTFCYTEQLELVLHWHAYIWFSDTYQVERSKVTEVNI